MSTNSLGLTRANYKGSVSTLCLGCGHDSITNHLITALYRSNISPKNVVKLSGIGCSSKTPAYFMSDSFGFNSLHGRMASVATGVHVANHKLKIIGISGDGDTASIGIGGFLHLIRRNVPMLYIVENNGVYGLTKGQFSATADHEMNLKGGEKNLFEGFDICALAIEAGAGFVARSFSGDAQQLVPLLQAALEFPGTAIIDVISPCVAFGDHPGSTSSYDYVKEHQISLQELSFIAPHEEITLDLKSGDGAFVKLPNGAQLFIRKKSDVGFDGRNEALTALRASHDRHEVLTGLFYLNSNRIPLGESLLLTETPFAHRTEADSRLGAKEIREYLSIRSNS